MTIDLNLLFSVSSAVNAVTSLTLGLFILLKNSQSKLNQLWWWMSLAVAVWATSLAVSFAAAPSDYSLSLFAIRLADTAAIFIPLLYLHFIVVFLGRTDQQKILRICYGISFLLACLGFSPIYISGLKTKMGITNYNDAGPLFWVFGILYVMEPMYAIRLMWQARQIATGDRKAHTTYVMAAGIVGFLMGATWFPLCFNIPILPIGGLFVWLYCLFVAWAVFKYRLFNIQVIIRQSVLYSLILALLLAAYFGLVYAAQQLFQMTLLQHHILALSLTALTTFGLGLLVFLAEPKRRLNQIFGLYSLAILGWSFTEAFLYGSTAQSAANFWAYFEWLPTIFIAPTFIHTVFLLIGENTQRARRMLAAGYVASFALLLLHLFANLIAAPPRLVGYSPFVNSLNGIGFLIPVIFLIVVNAALWKLWRAYRKATGQRRTQLKYLFWGSLVGYLGGAPDWFLTFGFYVPFVNPFGIYCVPMYSIATTYAVLQHRLFNVNLVIRKSLVYSLLVTILTVGYFSLAFGVERIFQMTFGYQSVWVSVASFALMALAFQPLKIGIQRLVDWLIFRVPQEELVRRVERLEGEAQKTEKLKAVATLAAGLSHELRSPLQAILTYAEFLPERFDDPDFREKCCEVMQSETGRINDLLNQLMNFAKPKPPSFELTEPHKILDSTLDLLSNEFLIRRVNLEKKYEANGLRIQADQNQLRQVILNLVLNALQAIGKNGQIIISTHQENGSFVLQIADTGPGIDPKILPKLFEPFNTTKPTGTGLGLSIVHNIVKEHRGKISAQSQPGQGTTFTIRFPAG